MIKVITGARQVARKLDAGTDVIGDTTTSDDAQSDPEVNAGTTTSGQKQSDDGATDVAAEISESAIPRDPVFVGVSKRRAGLERASKERERARAEREAMMLERGGTQQFRRLPTKDYMFRSGEYGVERVTEDALGRTETEPLGGFNLPAIKEFLFRLPISPTQRMRSPQGQVFAGTGLTPEKISDGIEQTERKKKEIENPEFVFGQPMTRFTLADLEKYQQTAESDLSTIYDLLDKTAPIDVEYERGRPGQIQSLSLSPTKQLRGIHMLNLTDDEADLWERITGTYIDDEGRIQSGYEEREPSADGTVKNDYQLIVDLYNKLNTDKILYRTELERRQARMRQLDDVAIMLKHQRKALLKSQEK